jgi:hypothetical protein
MVPAGAGQHGKMSLMPRFDGSHARTLDFGDAAGTTFTTTTVHGARAGLRLALPGGVLRGPDKYRVLESRRRRAQLAARHVLDVIDASERGAEGGGGIENA